MKCDLYIDRGVRLFISTLCNREIFSINFWHIIFKQGQKTRSKRLTCFCCRVICPQRRPWRPHRSQPLPATRPAPRTLSVAFWESVQLLMWASGRGTKVSTRMFLCTPCKSLDFSKIAIFFLACRNYICVCICIHSTSYINTFRDD